MRPSPDSFATAPLTTDWAELVAPTCGVARPASFEFGPLVGEASSGGLRPDPSKAIGADFVREAPGSQVEAADLATLRGLLYDDKSCRFDADVARCNFKPDVSFKVDSGLDTPEMLISFSCNQLLFYQGKPGVTRGAPSIGAPGHRKPLGTRSLVSEPSLAL